jgi:hypothetical protein
MRKVLIICAAAVLAGCAPVALSAPAQCAPTATQPAGRPYILLGRVDGCPNLLAVSGGPGVTLYIELGKLPIVPRGEG